MEPFIIPLEQMEKEVKKYEERLVNKFGPDFLDRIKRSKSNSNSEFIDIKNQIPHLSTKEFNDLLEDKSNKTSKQYKIIQEQYNNGTTRFYIQKKGLFFWNWICKEYIEGYGRQCFRNKEEAIKEIKSLLETNKKLVSSKEIDY